MELKFVKYKHSINLLNTLKKQFTFIFQLIILYYNRYNKLNLLYRGGLTMLTNSDHAMRDLTKRICSECGQPLNEKVENYLMECDYCLSKKPE